MAERDRFDEKFKEMAEDNSAAPIRWDRVAAATRRRAIGTLLGLVLLGVLLTAILATVILAGKTALDPSFSPPILSNTSASLDVKDPRLGRELVLSDGTRARGYVIEASLEMEGLRGDVLFPRWQFRKVGEVRDEVLRSSTSREGLDRIVPRSNDEVLRLRQWLQMPPDNGEYVVEVDLKPIGREVVASAKSAPFLAIGRDCCRKYETPSYKSVLPSGWSLEEDFEPQPEERFVTLAMGPYENSVLIDTSEVDEYKHRDALDNAHELEDLLSSNGADYRRMAWRVRHREGGPIVEWSYEIEGDVFTNILFYRDGWGFAVRGRGGQKYFRETRDLTRMVARSVDPHG
jgi:hypothetical protein